MTERKNFETPEVSANSSNRKLIPFCAVSKQLGYASATALRNAIQKGRVKPPLYRIGGRLYADERELDWFIQSCSVSYLFNHGHTKVAKNGDRLKRGKNCGELQS